jgi:SAM-dependent methyltransferase
MENWDEKYLSRERLFSGNPNGVLVDEVKGMTPGRALDVGCGEGGDAVWLARQGWRVTGVDVSRVALERAAASGVPGIEWVQGELPMRLDTFDLVSAQYFPLPRSADLTSLLDAVAPGGTLLFVGHDLAGLPAGMDPDPRDFYQPSEVAGLLDEAWEIEVDETRPRTAANPEGAHHSHDTVLRARRLQ